MAFPVNVGVYIGYEDIFDGTSPQNRLSLLNGCSKRVVLGLLAMINLHPKKDLISHEIPNNIQLEILQKLCLPDINFFNSILPKFQNLLDNPTRPAVIFHRTSLVVALNEILECEDLPHESDKELTGEAIIKYCLLVNSFLRNTQDAYNKKTKEFIDLYPVLATSNEHNTPFSPFMDLFRGIHLTNFFENDEDFSAEFKSYFESIGQPPQVYLPLVFSHIIPAANKEPDHPPIFRPSNEPSKKIIEELSGNKIIPSEPLEVLNLKRNPFYKWDEDTWLMLDIPFIVDNCFYYIINAFWFNHIKKKGVSHKLYFSKIGQFYEQYVSGVIKRSFQFLKHPAPKTLDELKVKSPETKTDIEIADVYIRQNKKVLLAEIKSTSFGTNFKYALDLIQSFEHNLPRFTKDFGITQVANAVEFFIKNPKMFDEKTKKGSNYKIFPAVIFNERFFQSPFSNLVFNNIFFKLLKEKFPAIEIPKKENQSIKYQNLIIYPITLIHSSDLEIIEPEIISKKVQIWDLFKEHFEKGKLHAPFYATIYKYITQDSVKYNLDKVKPILKEYDNRRKE